jgi:hypothetical protein
MSAATLPVNAVDIIKANNTSNLDTAGSWTTVAPTSADRAVWNGTVTAANTSNVAVTAAWLGIKIGDGTTSPGGNVGIGINTGRTLTLGTNGIDLSQSAVDLTISGNGNLRTASSASQSFNVPVGRALSVDTTMSTAGGTTTVTITGGGSVGFSKALSNGTSPLNIITTNSSTTTFTAGTSNITSLSGNSGGSVIINGATVNSNTSSTYGSSSTTAKFDLQSGTVNFNGAVGTSTTDGSLIKVSGGTFTATSVGLARTANVGQTNAPLTSGFVVTGGTASLSANLNVGTSNSSATARVDGGSLTIAGTANVGNTTNTRWSTLQVSNGTLDVNGADGVQLSTNTGTANSSQLLLTGGTTTVQAIKYGAAASVANSRGDVLVNSGSTLYIGSGGVSVVSANAYTANFNANGGTIGAKANWSTSVGIALTGNSTFRAADAASSSFDITLNGGLSGTGGLTKTGGGNLNLNTANNYTGSTTITAGSLVLGASGSITSPTIVNNGNFNVSAVTGGFTLASNQTLSGSGTVTGAMNVVGTLSPGNSPGTMSTGNLAWSNGGDYNWQVLDASGAAGTGYDTVSVTGTLDLASLTTGGFSLNLWSLLSTGPDVNGNATNFSDLLSYSWVLASTTGGVSGFDATDFVINTAANNGTSGFSNSFTGSFSVGVSGNNLMLNYSAIPEPSAALLGGLGVFALLRRRRA